VRKDLSDLPMGEENYKIIKIMIMITIIRTVCAGAGVQAARTLQETAVILTAGCS
jgi:hypothetical protein